MYAGLDTLNPFLSFPATTEYIVATTHITNGMSLINGILSETPNFHPVKIWDNQMDDPPVPPNMGRRPRR